MSLGPAIGIVFAFVFFFLGIFLLIAILFLLNLQNTFKAAAPENRKLPPNNVWLLLIPLFNFFYFFIVVRRLTETIIAEYYAKGQPLENPKPTYAVGMALAVLMVVSLAISFLQMPNTIGTYSAMGNGNFEEAMIQANSSSGALSSLSGLISVAYFILWIVYWVQTGSYKNKMRILPNNKSESEIFGGM